MKAAIESIRSSFKDSNSAIILKGVQVIEINILINKLIIFFNKLSYQKHVLRIAMKNFIMKWGIKNFKKLF